MITWTGRIFNQILVKDQNTIFNPKAEVFFFKCNVFLIEFYPMQNSKSQFTPIYLSLKIKSEKLYYNDQLLRGR